MIARSGHPNRAVLLGVLTLALCLPAAAKPKKPVLGFYPSWAPPAVRYDKITHLMYAFLLPSGSGSISGSVPGNVVSAAHAADVKVIASIGGANHSDAFPTLAASAGARSTFANACKAIVNSGVDGVDIDWEYPDDAQDSVNFTLLLKAIRAAIGPTKLISMDLAPNDEKGRWVSKSAVDIGDFYNVMAYDFTGSFPGSQVGQHSSYNHAVLGVNYWWRNRGVKKEKVIMGVPFYGKNFNAGGAPVDYRDIIAQNPNVSPDADQVGQTWYNGVTTIKRKAAYVAEQAYGGVMIWHLGGDASGSKSLLDAVEVGLSTPSAILVSKEGGGIALRGTAALASGLALPGLSASDLTGRRAAGTRAAAGLYVIQANR